VNDFDADKIPPVDLSRLSEARTLVPSPSRSALDLPAWLQIELPTERGVLRLVDFASAGQNGTHYRSWLATTQPPAPPAFTTHPRDGERVRPAATQFLWRGARGLTNLSYRLEIATDAEFTATLLATNGTDAGRIILDLASLPAATGADRWWRVITSGPNGEATPDVPPARFTLDATAPVQALPPSNKPGPKGELILHSLRGEEAPKFGELIAAKREARTADGTKLNGRDQMLVYSFPVWPEEDFTVALRVRIDEMPQGRPGQIFSGWAAVLDDPLRLTVENGKLFGRIESGQFLGTPGVPISAGAWHQIIAVKNGNTLKLFLDGQPAGSCAAPQFNTTAAHDCALGGNPHFTGDECLAATVADFGLWERALSDAEIQRLASP